MLVQLAKPSHSHCVFSWAMIVIKLLVLTSGNSPAPAGRTSYEIPRSGSSSSIWLPLRPVTIQEDKGDSPWSTYNLWRGPNINHTFSTLFCICFLWYQQGSSFESLNALKQFSSECHKTKTKVINWPIKRTEAIQ